MDLTNKQQSDWLIRMVATAIIQAKVPSKTKDNNTNSKSLSLTDQLLLKKDALKALPNDIDLWILFPIPNVKDNCKMPFDLVLHILKYLKHNGMLKQKM